VVFEDDGESKQTADRAEGAERNESNHQDWHNPLPAFIVAAPCGCRYDNSHKGL
jgi:hypothetical protein